MSTTVLQLNSSLRDSGSLSREVGSYLVERLVTKADDQLLQRDLAATHLPLITNEHANAYFIPSDQRTNEQHQLLSLSDELVAELKSAKELIIGVPIYNFSIAASLKAWIDLVCRVGETFAYEEGGPKGLIAAERAFIVVSSGGTEVGSDIDFASRYMEQVCCFLGIDEIHIIDVSGSKGEPDRLIAHAKEQVDSILLNAEG